MSKINQIGLFIQARTSSTRLPSKIFLPLDKETCILKYLIQELSNSKLKNNIVITTTVDSSDDRIVEFAKNNNIKFYRGSVENVYDRFYQASKIYNYRYICRICSDCPFININLINEMINIYSNNDFDILSSLSGPLGINKYISIFDIQKLSQYQEEFKPCHKEHVSKYFYDHIDKFNFKYILDCPIKNDSELYYNIRMNLDTKDDYQLILKIYKIANEENKKITKEYIINLYNQNKELFSLNTKNNTKEYEYCLKYYNNIKSLDNIIIYISNK